MNRRQLLALVIGTLAAAWFGPELVHAATCTGANPCKACKNCSSCAYCKKKGGTCGVCKKATS